MELNPNLSEKAQLDYVIAGGFAAIFRGKPLTTMDLDIIVKNNNFN